MLFVSRAVLKYKALGPASNKSRKFIFKKCVTAKLANDSINVNAAAKKVADGGVKAGGGTGVS